MKRGSSVCRVRFAVLCIPDIPCFTHEKVMKQVKLSKRLKALADLIGESESVADIGTDHGFLPVYFVQTGSVKRVIASDISPASLSAARRTADEAGVTDAITFHVAPGLDRIAPTDVDTIVIAGLGGETILDILNDAAWTKRKNIRLILQPQSKVDILCRFLYDNGYLFIGTKSVLDRGKNYTIIHLAGRE